MKALITLIAASQLMGCGAGIFAEVGAGHNGSFFNDSLEWENASELGFYGALRAEKQLTDRVTLVTQYAHYSQWLAGPPFNDDAESSLDHIGVAARFRLTE